MGADWPAHWVKPGEVEEKKPTPAAVGTAVDTDGDGVADVIVDEEGNETEV